jgi:hypothetical protein
MIWAAMRGNVRTGERQAYTSAVTDLWKRLGVALARLERIAQSPAEWSDDATLDELPGLQYVLHASAELALGITPPKGFEGAHAELVSALAEARDATAEVAQAAEIAGPEYVEPLLPEWRGALFRVRLARLRAIERPEIPVSADLPARPAEERPSFNRSGLAALLATGLVIGGGLLFTAGAVLAAWPIWAAGLMLATGGFLLVRP